MNAPKDSRTSPSLERGFQLGKLRIDPLEGELSGPGGCENLDPKVMDVLVLLAQHAGQLVSREEMLASIWPGMVVTDDALTRCIYELRRQLAQAGGDESYKALVETLPKRGYRLNGEITLLESRPGTQSRRWLKQHWLALAIVIPAVVLLLLVIGDRIAGPDAEPRSPSADAATNSIAVLPFVDMSAGEDQEYFSDGIAEEILNRLTQSPNLRVISRTSSFSFRDRPLDIREIASRLNVNHVLEGSIRRSANHLRVTAQLIAASSNAHVWSATYDRELGDLFTVQDEIAASVATALQATLASSAARDQPPINPEAYERFLRGQFFYNRRAPGDAELSAKYYQEAIAVDAGYARAWAALSAAYMLLVDSDPRSGMIWLARQGEAAHKAVELDPNLAVAHARLAMYYFSTADRQYGREHLRKARELDPNEPLARIGAPWSGDFKEAVAEQRQAVERDPLSPTARTNLGLVLMAAGQLDEAMSEFRKALELNPAAGWDKELEIGRIFVLQGRYDEAYSEIAQHSEADARDHLLALLWQAPGRLAEADAALKRLSVRPVKMNEVRLAELYAFRGMTEKAFASLQSVIDAIQHDDDSALPAAPRISQLQNEMQVSPFLKPLQTDPRWAALLADPFT